VRRRSAMKKLVALVVLVLSVSLMGVSDVRGGAALIPPGRTGGPPMIATIVTDVTGPQGTPGKGLSSIVVRRGSKTTAALFNSSGYVALFQDECLQQGFTDLRASTEARFVGLMNGWVGPQGVRDSLFAPFGVDPEGAAIVRVDQVAWTTVTDGAGGGTRQVLSFNATIRFQN
jgi:hypothetical protein